MNYSDKLKRPEWQKKRLKIFERDNWACCYCGSTQFTLNVHHEKYVGENPEDTPDEFLKTSCEDCHQLISIFNKLEKQKKINYSLVSIKIIYTSPQKNTWMRKAFFSDGGVMFFMYGDNDPTTNQRIMSFAPGDYKSFIEFISNE